MIRFPFFKDHSGCPSENGLYGDKQRDHIDKQLHQLKGDT